MKRYFGHLPCYVHLVDLMHKTAQTTFIGQSLDFQLSNTDVTQFTLKKYKCMVDCKTSHFAFYTPIALPMILAGWVPNMDKIQTKILNKKNHLFTQIQRWKNFQGYQRDFIRNWTFLSNTKWFSWLLWRTRCIEKTWHWYWRQKMHMARCNNHGNWKRSSKRNYEKILWKKWYAFMMECYAF